MDGIHCYPFSCTAWCCQYSRLYLANEWLGATTPCDCTQNEIGISNVDENLLTQMDIEGIRTSRRSIIHIVTVFVQQSYTNLAHCCHSHNSIERSCAQLRLKSEFPLVIDVVVLLDAKYSNDLPCEHSFAACCHWFKCPHTLTVTRFCAAIPPHPLSISWFVSEGGGLPRPTGIII